MDPISLLNDSQTGAIFKNQKYSRYLNACDLQKQKADNDCMKGLIYLYDSIWNLK